LKNQLEFATKAATAARDSLTSLQQFIGSVSVSKNSYINKVNELEAKELLTAAKQADLGHNVAELQSENKKPSQQLIEMCVQLQ